VVNWQQVKMNLILLEFIQMKKAEKLHFSLFLPI